MRHDTPKYTPSPEDIRRACEAIRATWSRHVIAQRDMRKPVEFDLPEVDTSELRFVHGIDFRDGDL